MADNTTLFRTARDYLISVADQYDSARTGFTWPAVTGRFNWATDWFDPMARGNDRTALWLVESDGAERRYSFDAMARRSDQVATWLKGLGVAKGDRVILMLGNQVELWESMLAVMKLGGIILPTTAALGPSDLTDRIERGQARYVIANHADTAKFADVPGEYTKICVGTAATGWYSYSDADQVRAETFTAATEASDPVLIYFTSGTTSKPKLVQHTQVSYPVGHLSTMYWIGVRPGDVHMTISSPGWAKHAWSLFFAPWIAEATILVYNYTQFDAAALIQQLDRAEANTFCAPPTVWRMLIQADLGPKPRGLREAVAAGEPLNPEVITQVNKAWGLTVRDGFGQTETTALVGNTPGSPVKPGSMGRPLPGVPVVLVDPATGQPGDEGEVCLDLSAAPVNLMTGYLGDPELDTAVMAGGHYHTGDVASRDADGYISYVGRTDDVFKSSDYKVSPFEVESALIEHPAVVEAAVVPQPDPTRLTVPKAYVALAGGWQPSRDTALEIFRYAREHLAPYLRVRRIEFAELPKTISGKIRRVQLRQREDRGEGAAGEFRYEDFPELRR